MTGGRKSEQALGGCGEGVAAFAAAPGKGEEAEVGEEEVGEEAVLPEGGARRGEEGGSGLEEAICALRGE